MDMIRRSCEHDARAAVPPTAAAMPDVVEEYGSMVECPLDSVGMDGIAVRLRLPGGLAVPARCHAAVSLDDPVAKGIHMSRLYLALQHGLRERELGTTTMVTLLEEFLASHRGLSAHAELAFDFDLLLERPSLVSDHVGWRSYPVRLAASLTNAGTPRFEISVRVTYSSTCPCSAALARQLIQERFTEEFGADGSLSAERVREWLGHEEAICATPHSQRSLADITVVAAPTSGIPTTEELIDAVEGALVTVVQAAVKREDEREFARQNSLNLMFCEDACRRIRAVLDRDERLLDYRVRTSHLESLHEHDAVAVVTKGVPGGLRA